MNDKIETHNNYEILDGDDDVLLLGQATFTVGRFKQLATINFRLRINRHISESMKELQINQETKIMGGDIKWNSPKEGIDCQVLKIGSKGWQKGKVQIEFNTNINSRETQVCIKFCPDEPAKQKSPLDDIRQSEEYKKLSNNN